MTLTPSLPNGDSAGLPLTARRIIQAGMVAQAANGTPRTGLLSPVGAVVVSGKGSMGYDIADFVAVTARISPGCEFVANSGIYDLSPAGYAPPVANSRIDVIWVRSRLTAAGDSVDAPEFGITQGTAGPTPTKPSVPPGALELASAEVKATDTTTATVVITQTARFTAMARGVVPLRTQADQDGWTPADGAIAFRLDTKQMMRRVGGAWAKLDGDKLVRMVAGTAAGALPTAGAWVSLVTQQTIPASPFGPGVPYLVRVYALSNATMTAATYALRVLLDGAAPTVGAQAQVAGTGGISVSAEGRKLITNPDVTHLVDAQIARLEGAVNVQSGSAISFLVIELERAATF